MFILIGGTFSTGTRINLLAENRLEIVINMPCVKNLQTGVQRFVTHSIFFLKFSPITVCENTSQTRKKLAEPTTTK